MRHHHVRQECRLVERLALTLWRWVTVVSVLTAPKRASADAAPAHPCPVAVITDSLEDAARPDPLDSRTSAKELELNHATVGTHLMRLRLAAASQRDVQAVAGSAVHRQGTRHRRPVRPTPEHAAGFWNRRRPNATLERNAPILTVRIRWSERRPDYHLLKDEVFFQLSSWSPASSSARSSSASTDSSSSSDD